MQRRHEDARARQGHAVLDLPSRDLKAIKIARLLGLDTAPPGRLLEVGCGSGGIARYFADVLRWDVTAVDVEDVRLVKDGFAFLLVDGTELPFDEASFDVVLSNHVIEHVGGTPAQHRHLRELFRVLRPDGVGYLAVPNRWMLVEPHYKLPFLSWLPRALRDAYVRAARKGTHYDCVPLSLRELSALLAGAGLRGENVSSAALRQMVDLERGAGRQARIVNALPRRLVDAWLLPLFPTLCYRFDRADPSQGPSRGVA